MASIKNLLVSTLCSAYFDIMKKITLGSKIKRLRKSLDLTQSELAKKIGADAVRVSTYENDKVMPSSEVLIKLAEVFNVSVDYLVRENIDSFSPVNIRDKELLRRVEQLDRLNSDSKQTLYKLLDMFIHVQQVKDLAKAS
jgi:transcriptional regulator with XRE-family HTH domain